MSVARAICTCKTCGCEFEMTAYKRNRAECNSWSKWASEHYDECDDCRNARISAEREAEAKEAAAAAKEMGLPELEGTHKQIAWAERIRIQFVGEWNEWEPAVVERFQAGRKGGVTQESFWETKNYIMSQKKASWWIDHKEDLLDPIGYVRGKKAYESFYKKAHESFLKEEVKAETPAPEIIEPEGKAHDTVCTITANDEAIVVKSDYNAAMPPIVRTLGYKWDTDRRIWKKAISYRIPSAEDAMAEVANKLLSGGFPVIVPPEVKGKAVNGTYEPEHRRWIVWWADDRKLGISGDVDPKGIPGYRRGKVGLEAYAEVEEFARTHDYRFSPGAREAIDAHKARITKAAVVEGKGPEYQDKSGEIAAILHSSTDVLKELVDED